MHAVVKHIVDKVQAAGNSQHLLRAQLGVGLGRGAGTDGERRGGVVCVQHPAQVVTVRLQLSAVTQAQHARVVTQIAVEPQPLLLCGHSLCIAQVHMSI